jgi:hypothetical protein
VPLISGDQHVHHHGALAGVGAGTAAVLIGGLLLLGVWHKVAGQVGVAVTVLVWALVAAVLAAAVYAVAFLALRLRHHVTHPETLTRHVVRAEVIPPALPAPAVPAVPAAEPLAALPPPVAHHWHLNDPDTAAAVIRAVSDSTTEGKSHE